jgi:hypothetical protein
MLLKIMARGKVGRGAILDDPMKARGLLPVIQSPCWLLELTHQAKRAKLLPLSGLFRRQICRIALICGLTGGVRGLISHGENEQQQKEYRKHQHTYFSGTHIKFSLPV